MGNAEQAPTYHLVHAGVRGAGRTTWRAFETGIEAHAYAERVLRSGAEGETWAEVYPAPRVLESLTSYTARTGVDPSRGSWCELLDATIRYLDGEFGNGVDLTVHVHYRPGYGYSVVRSATPSEHDALGSDLVVVSGPYTTKQHAESVLHGWHRRAVERLESAAAARGAETDDNRA